jgi:glutamine synthetase
VTHYTHWFQPLTGTTAKNMMLFLKRYDGSDPVEKFGGAQLVQQEPDASSFPNGGISTLKPEDILLGILLLQLLYMEPLYVFLPFSYTGEALDNKIPYYEHYLLWILLQQKWYFDKMLKRLQQL